jgi:pilus assembly protein Flp/PilA
MGGRRFLRADDGAVAIEYGLLAAVVALGIVAALTSTRSTLSSTFQTVATDMSMGVSPPLLANRGTPTRTVVNRPWGQTLYTYTYPDGSTAEYATPSNFNGSFYRPYTRLTDAQTGTTYTYTPPATSASGVAYTGTIAVATRYADGNQKTSESYTFDPSGGTASGTIYTYPDVAGGSSTGSSAGSITLADYQALINQYDVYSANP